MRLLATAPGGFSDFIPSVAVIDLLEIPETIEPGEYVLQYRYDSEQTPQVWNTCSGEHHPSLSASPFLNARQSFSAPALSACCRHQDPSEGAGPAPDQQVRPEAAAVASAPARQARFVPVPAERKEARRSAVLPCLRRMECPCDPTGGLEHVRGTDNGTASERAAGRPAAPHRLSHPRLARGQLAQRGGAERVHGQRAGVRTL